MIKLAFMEHRGRMVLTGLLSTLGAGLTIYLLDFLHKVAQAIPNRPLDDWLPEYLLYVFLLFGLALTANLLLVHLACRLVARLRESLVRQVLAAKYSHLESLGKGKLLASLTDDIDNISEGMVIGPQLLFNMITVVLCLGYLAYLSPKSFILFFFILCAGGAITWVIITRGNKFYDLYRKEKNQYYSHLHEMFDGAKELATDDARRSFFLEKELLPAVFRLKSAELKRETYWNIGETWTRIFLFIALGIAVLSTSIVGGTTSLTMSYFIVITFIAGPIEAVINALSSLAKAARSAKCLRELEIEPVNDAGVGQNDPCPVDWSTLECCDITYISHSKDVTPPFSLGPVSLTIKRGEVLFLTGGNGSGKTTFAKVLVGLYQRSSGVINVGDQSQAQEPGNEYRSLFSTVFSDYYLFRTLLDEQGMPAHENLTTPGLKRLQLDSKVTLDNGRLSTIALSQGQRKRLALLQCWLNNAPICVLDEWAADQDPGAREHFYREILPAMKRDGKTLVVISHDDRYYDLADRIAHFESGRIGYISEKTIENAPA